MVVVCALLFSFSLTMRYSGCGLLSSLASSPSVMYSFHSLMDRLLVLFFRNCNGFFPMPCGGGVSLPSSNRLRLLFCRGEGEKAPGRVLCSSSDSYYFLSPGMHHKGHFI